MPLPPLTQKKYCDRFQDLIIEGEAIKSGIKTVSGRCIENPYAFLESQQRLPDSMTMDWQRQAKWRLNCVSLLHAVVPSPGPHDAALKIFQKEMGPPALDLAISILEGFRDDFERGFLDDISVAIEAEIAADYMGHAESLIREGQTGKYDYVPAAVLAGAVLEKSLRTLCRTQQPPLVETNAKGEPKTLNPLIEDLKKAGVFNELKAKQLRSWADVRNKAAHGKFGEFTNADVEQMLQGINNFLSDYLK
jgi:hypothetical protein